MVEYINSLLVNSLLGLPSISCQYQRAAPIAVPSSPQAGCKNIFLNLDLLKATWFATEFKAPPPLKQIFGSILFAMQ